MLASDLPALCRTIQWLLCYTKGPGVNVLSDPGDRATLVVSPENAERTMQYIVQIQVRSTAYEDDTPALESALLTAFKSMVGPYFSVSVNVPDKSQVTKLKHIMNLGLIWFRAVLWTFSDLALDRKVAADECADYSPSTVIAKYQELADMYKKWIRLHPSHLAINMDMRTQFQRDANISAASAVSCINMSIRHGDYDRATRMCNALEPYKDGRFIYPDIENKLIHAILLASFLSNEPASLDSLAQQALGSAQGSGNRRWLESCQDLLDKKYLAHDFAVLTHWASAYKVTWLRV